MSNIEDMAQLPHQILPIIRQSKHLSIKQVASALYVKQHTVELLERGAYQDLFGDAYICGLVRSYAALLDIDAEAMILSYKKSGFHQQPEKELNPLVVAAYPTLQHKTYKTIYGIIIVIIMVIIFGVIANNKVKMGKHVTPTTVSIDMADKIQELPLEEAEHALSIIAPDVKLNRVSENTQPVLNGMSASELLEVEVSTLIFTFTADCWVEVKDANDIVLLSATQHANQSFKIKGLAPFKVILGNAPAVTLLFNNHPVLITADPSNTAKLMIGKN